MTPQFGASFTDDFSVVIYDCNVFMIQVTGMGCIVSKKMLCYFSLNWVLVTFVNYTLSVVNTSVQLFVIMAAG